MEPELLMRSQWKEKGRSVPAAAVPAKIETWRHYNHGSGERHLFSYEQTKPLRVINKTEPKALDLIFAIREASRSAHRWRDAAQAQYLASQFGFASASKAKKNDWYVYKDRGIVAAHQNGQLRYIGASPQGMAVYEYGEGGMSCFHSTLHPIGAPRPIIEGHPEILTVAKKQAEAIMRDVEFTLRNLPIVDLTKYERTAAPSYPKPKRTCFNCGGEGHIARNCPENQEEERDFEAEMAEAWEMNKSGNHI